MIYEIFMKFFPKVIWKLFYFQVFIWQLID